MRHHFSTEQYAPYRYETGLHIFHSTSLSTYNIPTLLPACGNLGKVERRQSAGRATQIQVEVEIQGGSAWGISHQISLTFFLKNH